MTTAERIESVFTSDRFGEDLFERFSLHKDALEKCELRNCFKLGKITQVCDLRLVSTHDNFPQDGNGQESFLCLVSSRSELMALTQRKLSCPFLS